MFKKSFVVVALLACFAGTAVADIVSPDSSYVTVQYGTAKRRVTMVPSGNGETFTSVGNEMTIKVYLKNGAGSPLAGVPATEVIMTSSQTDPGFCICPGGNIADAQTDLNGATTFSGSLRVGGCVNSLTVFADGIGIPRRLVAGLSPPSSLDLLALNSHDITPASPCAVDLSDIASLAPKRGSTQGGGPPYTICADWNEDGAIDLSEVASMAQQVGAACP